MSFVDPVFPLFVLIAWAALHAAPTQHRWIRLGASCLFYAYSGVFTFGLLLVSSLVNYGLVKQVARGGTMRGWWLGWSVVVNLVPLTVFKFTDFLVLELASAGGPRLAAPDWVLPLGISFWTFQAMAWTMDVGRGDGRAPKNLVEYLLFHTWFPQLVAGPIERASRMLPQFERFVPLGWAATRVGISLALWGAFKKVVVADSLGPYVDKVFARSEPGAPLLAVAGLAFMVQVYADFSGYTDIARGVSALFGVTLSENFKRPWLAASTPEFWSRWHVTMTTWIRDYALGPFLGVGPPSRIREAVAVVGVLLLMGAWHGAGWNYLVFGLWHAFWMLLWSWSGVRPPAGGWRRVPFVVFHHVVVGWFGALLFREPDPFRLARTLTGSWSPLPSDLAAMGTLLALAVAGGCAVAFAEKQEGWLTRLAVREWERPVRVTGWAVAVGAVFVFGNEMGSDFVYFKF